MPCAWTRSLLAVLACLLALGGCTAGGAPDAGPGSVHRRPCPGQHALECITLPVPADHFAPRSPTWQVTFALHRGTVDSRGVLVTAAGGPGDSGIDEAGADLSAMSRSLTDHYDLVFFDQRGVGRSEPFRCDRALAADRTGQLRSTASAAERDAFATAAQQFAGACLAEAGVDPADAGRYATRQAVEDLEAFRQWLGAPSLILYGESYGTQFQQTYAAVHPDRVAAMVLDGVVDLATDALTMAIETAQAYSDVLAATLAACDAEPACARDAPGSALAGYDQLAGRLPDLQSAAEGSLSDPDSRRELQRALNAAVRGQDAPLARLARQNAGDLGGGGTGPAHVPEDAAYDAVECQDYDFVPPGTSGRRQLDVWLAAAGAAGVDRERLGTVFSTDLPCLFWPRGAAGPVPPAPADPTYPLLLLTADTDPNTPTANAHRVLARATGAAALVVVHGGPHVVYGRGDSCVDDVVTALVTRGRLPAARVTSCPGQVATPYRVR